jgi:hypothetical protein
MDLFLKAILGSDVELLDKDLPAEDALTQFRSRLERAEVRKHVGGVADAGWDTLLTAAPVEKREKPFANPLGFDKSSHGYELKIDHIEEKIIDGETWQYAYSAGELVEARDVKG